MNISTWLSASRKQAFAKSFILLRVTKGDEYTSKIPLYFNPFNRHTFSSIMKRDSFTKESLGVVVVNVLKKYVKMISLHMT